MNAVDIDPIRAQLLAAIEEDIGSGDITSQATVDASAVGIGSYVAKQRLIVSGIAVVEAVVHLVDPGLEYSACVEDGQEVEAGALVAWVQGNARSILAAERTSLNLLQRMAGIATLTRRYVAAIEGTRASILDTRKTAPGLRRLDKYAVACGGGVNHRIGLFDGILIKNNHLVFHPGAGAAVRRAKAQIGEGIPVEVEVRDLADLGEVLASGVDTVLLDNFTPEEARRAVRVIAGRAVVEASGGITLDNVRRFAEAGVDRISVGALTHSVAAADIHLKLTPIEPPPRP